MAEATKEICNILAKGQLKTGMNPLAALDGVMSGSIAEAVIGGTEAGATSAMYAKRGKIHTKTMSIPMDCSVKESSHQIKETAVKLKKRLVTLSDAPTPHPYIAYYNQGILANPTVVVAEIRKSSQGSEIMLTAFTTKVGFVRGHSCNAAFKRFTKLF